MNLLAALAALALVMAPAPARTLDIYFVDVEGGAATLIVTPAGQSLLVDSGWPREDGRDARRIYQTAQQAGIRRIDFLLTTHFHRDHWGGVEQLHKLIPIGKYLDHGRRTELAEDPQNFPGLNAAYREASQGQSQALHPGDEIPLKGLRVKVLTSNGEALRASGPENPACLGAKLIEDDPTDNARSVGILLTFGKFRFLDLGDLTWNVEQKLVCPSNVIGVVDLYQVTHHGAAISNNPVLLDSVKPQVAIMNNGPRKGGDPAVLPRLRGVAGVEAVYQVHRNVDTKDGDNTAPEFIANLGPEEGCPGNLIKVSVPPGGSEYTVTNSRTGLSRKYRISR